MSVTRTTVEGDHAQAGGGRWEALSHIDQHSNLVRIRKLRTGSRFTICIVDCRHVPEDNVAKK